MAKIGYLMRSAHYEGAESDIEWIMVVARL